MSNVFELSQLIFERRRMGGPWHEFLRVPVLSMGVYTLPAGANDPQQPHTEDEVYYIVSGQAMLRIGDRDHPVRSGTVAHVPARAPHGFHSITEEVTALVLFTPAEGSLGTV